MNCFVTGATGAVGKSLLPKLCEQGWKMTVLTRRAPSVPAAAAQVSYVVGDVRNEAVIEAALRDGGPNDVFLHLAASLDYFGTREDVFAINAGGASLMARLAKKHGVKRFIYASSIEACGPARSDQIPVGPADFHEPLTAYGKSKQAAERAVMEASGPDFSILCLRIGNVYGPGWDNFVVQYANALLTKGILFDHLGLYEDRYITPVWNDDVAAGIVVAAQSAETGVAHLVGQAAKIGEIFHLCADALKIGCEPRATKISDYISVSLQVSLFQSFGFGDIGEFGYLMTPSWPRIHRCAAVEPCAKRIGFAAPLPLREGIGRTIDWAARAGLLIRP